MNLQRLIMGVIGLVTMAALPAAHAQNIFPAGQFNWVNISQGECFRRAQMAGPAAVAQFNLPITVGEFDGWLVGSSNQPLHVQIACLGDDETNRIANPAAPRVLIVINVEATQGGLPGNVRNFLRECMHTGTCPGQANGNNGGGNDRPPTRDPNATDINWRASASNHRGRNNEVFAYFCPPRGSTRHAVVWGTDIYTDDSGICSAAVHAGFLTDAGGSVWIQILGRQERYTGSPRNGVTTSNYGGWGGSYRFVFVER
ncbi:LCCL domain-containing protein [Hyphobacterium sp.]|uniref:LCCL domain-containing protein n=1 Tax=Hyphobacterium sp. TaxID=2004662 RepID=UPI003BABB85B